MEKLAVFLATQLREREMSVRAFAQFVGVPHALILKFLNKKGEDTGYPSIEFIKKLAVATDADPCAILEMVIPEAFTHKAQPAELLMLAEQLKELSLVSVSEVITLAKRLERLPPEARLAIDAIIERYEGIS